MSTRNNILGEGTSGIVFVTSDGKHAYKEYKITDNDNDCFVPESIREVSIMKTLEMDPYIQKVEESNFSSGVNGYSMKLYPYSLRGLMGTRNIERKLAKRILYEILVGLYYAHKKFIIHADIKPDNILVGVNNNIVIADWGISQIEYITNISNKQFPVQTLYYRAPEVLLGDYDYTTKIDIWSSAVVYYEMIYSTFLFMGNNEKELYFDITKYLGVPNTLDWPEIDDLDEYAGNPYQYSKPKFPTTGDAIADDLLFNMLIFNPNKRFSATEALNHPFFDDIRRDIFIDNTLLYDINNIQSLILSANLDDRKRTKVINWLSAVCQQLHSDISVFFYSVILFDYMMSLNSKLDLFLTIIACVYLSSMFCEINPISMDDLLTITSNTYSSDVICGMTYDIYHTLNYNLYFLTPIMYLNILSQYIYDIYSIKLNKSSIIDLLKSSISYSEYLSYDNATLCLAAVHVISDINNFPNILEESGLISNFQINQLNNAIKFLYTIK